MAAVQDLLAAAGATITWVAPSDPSDREAVVAAIRATRRALVGFASAKDGGVAPAVRLRRELGVFAQHRPVRFVPGLPGVPGVDLLLVRETTEDVYAQLEHSSVPGVFESLKVTTRAACERIARHACTVALAAGRRRVTIVHKANILKKSDGLFLDTARAILASFPELAFDDVIVDALCMKLVLDPTRFDVLLCGNLYGDIVGDLCAGLVGGASNAPTVSHAPGDVVVYGAGHGDAPARDGTDDADPFPILLPALHLLRDVGQGPIAVRLAAAIVAALGGPARPCAVGGTASLATFLSAVRG
jgi:isocitrate dehydrogenase (NAD+)